MMSEAKERRKLCFCEALTQSPSRWLNPNPNLSYIQPSLQVYIYRALNFNVLPRKNANSMSDRSEIREERRCKPSLLLKITPM